MTEPTGATAQATIAPTARRGGSTRIGGAGPIADRVAGPQESTDRKMARLEGFEPPTNGFGSHYSIRLSYRRLD